MAVDPARAKSLSLEAAELASPQERAAYLDRECGGEPELRARIEALLAAHDRTGLSLILEPDATGVSDPDPGATCDATAPPPGTARAELTQLGHFRIIKLIAKGGMGAVYEAIDLQLGRSVALKLMRPSAAGHEKAHARFLREARTAAQLEHDHIVPIYQVGQDKGVPYLAMQLLRGQTLDERLRHGPPIATNEVLRIGREIAEGLAAAHGRGLIHRDIKPANVWLEEGSGRVKILDFGLARVANETAPLTQDGSILGTPAYMAPEQASGSSAVDHRSDLFSLGSVLYRMSTSKLPFPASSSGAMLMALVRDDPVPPRQINPEIPPALEALILGLLAKEPDRRPQAAQAVVDLIRGLERTEQPGARDGVDLEVTVEEPGPLLPARRASRPLAAVVSFLVLVGALVAGSSLLPWFLDEAGSTGELILDSPVRGVAVGVSRDGRTVGVLDPATRPTLRLPAGPYALNLASATEPLKLAVPRIDLRRGGRQVVRVVRNIPAAPAAEAPEPAPSGEAVGAALTDADVQRIAALPAVKQVDEVRRELVRRNPGFDGKVGHKIEEGVVTELRINTDMVTDISPIRVFNDLRVLDCHGTFTHGQPNGTLSDLTPLKGMNLAGLKHLDLNDTQVSDAGLVYFKPCKDLEYLDLFRTRVGDAGLAHFKDCKNLTTLLLSETQTTDVGLAHFKDCKNLTKLALRGTQTSDAGLAHFKDCKKLTQLMLGSPRVSDAGLAHFKGCRDLWLLQLLGTEVSDAGLANFKGMPLRVLWIFDTGITDLTALQGMALEEIRLTPTNITQGLDILRDMKSLKTIGIGWTPQAWPASEFWARYDKGEFK